MNRRYSACPNLAPLVGVCIGGILPISKLKHCASCSRKSFHCCVKDASGYGELRGSWDCDWLAVTFDHTPIQTFPLIDNKV